VEVILDVAAKLGAADSTDAAKQAKTTAIFMRQSCHEPRLAQRAETQK